MSDSPANPPGDLPEKAPPEHRARRLVIGALKAACGAALLGFLFWQAQQSEALSQLATQPKDWGMLGAALVLTITAILVSFLRWRLVVRAAEIEISLTEAIRIGALGFALNFVSPGAIGGDLFKALILARGRAGQRTAAMTTIVVDRACGLLAMLIVASTAILLARSHWPEMSGEVRVALETTLTIAIIGVVTAAVLMTPGVVGPWLRNLVERVPGAGGVLVQLVDTWSTYRRHAWRLAAALGMCLVVHALLVCSFYCVALGLPLDSPGLLHHFYIVPIELTAGAIPITPGGVGTREAVVEGFYRGLGIAKGQGTLIAFGHSLTMLATGGVATAYYFSRQSLVRSTVSSPEIRRAE